MFSVKVGDEVMSLKIMPYLGCVVFLVCCGE
jgi:hypothetical protein